MSKRDQHPFIQRIRVNNNDGYEFKTLLKSYYYACFLLSSLCLLDFYKRRNLARLGIGLVISPFAASGFVTIGKSPASLASMHNLAVEYCIFKKRSLLIRYT